MKFPPFPRPRLHRSRRAVALIIVLAFVVLLTGVIVAFFSRAISDRQVSNSGANETKVNLFAQGAADRIISNLQQEIVLSSSATPFTTGTVYTPLPATTTPVVMLPQMSGTAVSSVTNWAPNLLVRSGSGASNQYFYSGKNISGSTVTIPSGAIPVSSLTPSLDGHWVSLARWNSHYLLPLPPGATATSDSTPDTSRFAAPDWVLVDRSGASPTNWNASQMATSSTNSTTVVGRYAYAIYHEGGLLDANVAGYPTGYPVTPAVTSTNQFAYKPALAYADLTQLPGGVTSKQWDELVAWRNYASTRVSGGFQSPGFSLTSGSSYFNSVVSNPYGFLKISGTALNNNGAMGSVGQSDRMFGSRQELIRFMRNGLGLSGTSLNCLNYLATFTRDLNQPSFTPDPSRPKVLDPQSGGNNSKGFDDQINPPFLTIRGSGSFLRNDNSSTAVGEPLVKKRFALNRLAWLTYKGPSAIRTQYSLGAAAPATNNPDYDMWALVNLYGVSPSLLKQGTAANIQKYFGLTWTPGYSDRAGPKLFSAWVYNYNNNDPAGQFSAKQASVGSKGPILQLVTIAGLGAKAHEPDFFELLKAAVNVGSVGKATTESSSAALNQTGNGTTIGVPSSSVPANYRYNLDTTVDYQIIQMGANILSQSKVDGYPVHIVFNNGGGDRIFTGVANLPYLNTLFMAAIASASKKPVPDASGLPTSNSPPYIAPVAVSGSSASLSATGLAALLQIPVLWNPHDINGTFPALRPTNFRLVVDSVDPDHIDPTGSGNGYMQYYPLSYANTAISGSNAPTFPFIDWTHRDSSTPASGISNLDQAPGTTPIPKVLTWSSTALSFSVPNATLFREPTILFRSGTTGLQLADAENGASSSAWSLTTDFGTNTVITSGTDPLTVPPQSGGPLDPPNSKLLGIYLGPFPLRYNLVDKNNKKWTVTTDKIEYNLGGSRAANAGVYLTYRLQYQDPTNRSNWITYDTKYGGIGISDAPQYHYMQAGYPAAIFEQASRAQAFQTAAYSAGWATAMDPRTARFGFVFGKEHESFTGNESLGPIAIQALSPADQYTHGWIDAANGVIHTVRPDRQAGYVVFGNHNNTSNGAVKTPDMPTPTTNAGWMAPNDDYFGQLFADIFAPGMVTQNNVSVRFSYGRWSSSNGPNQHGRPQQNPLVYADADGVVRRSMGGYVPTTANTGASPVIVSDSTIGLPMARATQYVSPPPTPPSLSNADPTATKYISESPTWRLNQAQSRPLFLNRPFRSVAELGYVFSDTPWRNLDFFTPESGNAALLDVFCIQDTDDSGGLVAGKVNLNTRQPPVLAAIVSNAYVDDPKVTDTTIGTLSPTAAAAISQALVARTGNVAYGPLQNISELVGKWVSSSAPTTALTDNKPIRAYPANMLDGKNSYAGFSGIYISPAGGVTQAASPPADLSSVYANTFASNAPLLQSMTDIQRLHEAPIRALSSTTQTRVWNLLIDVVAQTGRYPTTASTADKFIVEGEQRYWVHVAIDRFTGQVIDKQIEVVKE